MAASVCCCKAETGSQRSPDETETGSCLFNVYGSSATLTHFLSLCPAPSFFIFLPYFRCGRSPLLPSFLPSFIPSFLHFPFDFFFFHLFFSFFQPSSPLCFTLVSASLSSLSLIFITSSPLPSVFLPPSFSLPLSLSSGLTKDGGGSANAESLEEVLDILAEEGSDWIYGFFTFLYDVVSSPIERGEEEEEGKEAAAVAKRREEEGGATSSDDEEVKGVILDLQNQ